MEPILTDLTPPEGFQRLLQVTAPAVGLRAYICLHSTTLGPATGGCRMWPYASEAEAIHDVTRLARGMTYKNAMAGLGLGGGKSVIIGDSRHDKTPQLLQAYGRAVEALAGRYYVAEDVGITPEDMAEIATRTGYAVGLADGPHGSGDPSPWTAEGVFRCLKVGAMRVFGSDRLQGKRVLVQGLGHVGWLLAEKLHVAGAELIVTDLDPDASQKARQRLGARICAPDSVLDQDMDIFAPCALGGILTNASVARLSARLVCGSANNQLANDDVAETLRQRDITYLPDYVVNAGGVISVASEIHRKDEQWRRARVDGIAGRIAEMLTRAQAEGRTTTAIADSMVEQMLAQRPDG